MDDLLHNGAFRLDAGPSNEPFDDREEVEPVVEQVDEPICRVCRSGREDGPLFHPCKCTGSIRYVHEQCLSDWLSVRKASTPTCELCNTKIRYKKVFAQDMPSKLPTRMLVKRSVLAMGYVVAMMLRAVLVAFIWLALLPFDTYWLFRLYIWAAEGFAALTRIVFQRPTAFERQHMANLTELAARAALDHLPANGTCPNPRGNLTTLTGWQHSLEQTSRYDDGSDIFHRILKTAIYETFQGQIITSCIVIVFVAGFLLREWILMNAPLVEGGVVPPGEAPPPAVPPAVALGGPEADIEQRRRDLMAAVRALPPDMQDRLQPQLANRLIALALEADADEPQRNRAFEQAQQLGEELRAGREQRQRERQQARPDLFEADRADHNDWVDDDDEQQEQVANVDDDRPVMDPAAIMGAPFPDDADAEDPLFLEDDLDGILEAIGMKGSLLVLIQNMGLMNLLVALCLGVAFFFPLSVGKVLAAANAVKILTAPVRAVRSITDPTFDWLLQAALWAGRRVLHRFSHRVPQALSNLVTKITSTRNSDQSSSNVMVVKAKARLTTIFADVYTLWLKMGLEDDSQLRIWCTVSGYLFALALAGCYLHGTRSSYGASVNRALRDGVKQQLVLFKVAAFMVVELYAFPSMCGALIQLCTLPLFEDSSIRGRLALYSAKPFTMTFLTWLPGSLYMFVFSVAVDGVRASVREGLCWWLRDPSSAEFHPIREILERNSLTQARKIATSAMLYAFTIFAIFGVSIQFLRHVLVGLLPLRWNYTRSFAAPLDLLAYRFLLPLAIQHLHPKSRLCDAFLDIARRCAHELRLSDFIFGKRDPSEEGSHVRLTWRAWFTLKKAKLTMVDGNCQTENYSSPGAGPHVDVVFRPDGSHGRVPAVDNVRVVPGRRMVIPVTEAGEPVDEAARSIVREQEAEMQTTRKNDKYKVVYLPPAWKVRLCLFIYSLWFIGMIVGVCLVVVPLQTGRMILGHFGAAPHDTYSLSLGVILFVTASAAVNLIKSLRQAHLQVVDLRVASKALAVASIAFAAFVVVPLFFGFLAYAYSVFPLEAWHALRPSPLSGTTNEEVVLEFPVITGWSIGLVVFDVLGLMSRGIFSKFMPTCIINISFVKTLFAEGQYAESIELFAKRTLLPLLGHLGLRVAAVLAFEGAKVRWADSMTTLPRGSSGALLMLGDALWVAVVVGGRKYSNWTNAVREQEFLVERRLLNFDNAGSVPAQSS